MRRCPSSWSYCRNNLRVCKRGATDDSVSMLFLNPSIIAFIKGHAGFQLLQTNIRQGIQSFDSATPAIDSFLREPILLAALPRAPIVDAL